MWNNPRTSRAVLPLFLTVYVIAVALIVSSAYHLRSLGWRSDGLFINNPFAGVRRSSRGCSRYLHTQQSSEDTTHFVEPISVGFIGCGVIASAIATGLSKQKLVPIDSIVVTKRSESKSKQLVEAFPDLVQIVTTMPTSENFSTDKSSDEVQQVIDSSQFVFVCVLPEQLESLLNEATFDTEKHTLVSLVAGPTGDLEKLQAMSGLPQEKVFRMICNTAVAYHKGVCLVAPKCNSLLKDIFETLGACVDCENEYLLRRAMIPFCLMGPQYGILRMTQNWLIEQGLPGADASYLVGKMYLSMLYDAERRCEDPTHFENLIAEQTPGGLNEQALKNLERFDFFENYELTMIALLDRLEGRTDGSIASNGN